ncbi:MAG: hypothetical protein EA362_07595 [Saprospirales bacterium]|nr:MAG: hypothetical protein EA362_07595 [Saprospirales bacterium]
MLLLSCSFFEDDPLDPAYIHIDSHSISVKPEQGSAHHDISDSWVYLDGSLLGAYEKGTDIPWLDAGGNNQILVFPGIRDNGIRSLPTIYPMLRPDTFQVNFEPLNMDTLKPVYRYFDDVVFLINEGFEFGNFLTVDLDLNENTKVVRSRDDAFEGNYSAKLQVDSENIALEVASEFVYTGLPNGRPVYLELHYKNDHPFSVGLLGERIEASPTRFYKLTLRPTDEWKKVYINFQEEITFTDFQGYRLLFGLQWEEDHISDTATVYLDNVKFLHR